MSAYHILVAGKHSFLEGGSEQCTFVSTTDHSMQCVDPTLHDEGHLLSLSGGSLFLCGTLEEDG